MMPWQLSTRNSLTYMSDQPTSTPNMEVCGGITVLVLPFINSYFLNIFGRPLFGRFDSTSCLWIWWWKPPSPITPINIFNFSSSSSCPDLKTHIPCMPFVSLSPDCPYSRKEGADPWDHHSCRMHNGSGWPVSPEGQITRPGVQGEFAGWNVRTLLVFSIMSRCRCDTLPIWDVPKDKKSRIQKIRLSFHYVK